MNNYVTRGFVSLAIVGSAVLGSGCRGVWDTLTYDPTPSMRERPMTDMWYECEEYKSESLENVEDQKEE